MFEIIESGIGGCFEIVGKRMSDNRGWFNKTYHAEAFAKLGINFEIREEYFSYSTKNVFRGMHFQVPPTSIDKLITCITGSITDFVVDIRKDSPTFGRSATFKLDAGSPRAVFVPKGLAHGFLATSDEAIVQCKSSGVFDPETDTTISYRSFDIEKFINEPVLSERDRNAIMFSAFNNPF